MRIGREKTFEQSAALYDWVNESGYGIMSNANAFSWWGVGPVPKECLAFQEDVFKQCGLPIPPEDLIDVAARAVYYIIDVADPYCLLCGSTEVVYTENWRTYAYEVYDVVEQRVQEAKPEYLETFSLLPGNDEKMFQEYCLKYDEIRNGLTEETRHLGPAKLLNSLPVGFEIEDYLFSRDMFEENPQCFDEVCDETNDWLLKHCRDGYESADDTHMPFNAERAANYFRFASWAAFLWFQGPYGRDFRYNNHEAFMLCRDYGEAVLYKGMFLKPEWVKRLDRETQSCYACGLNSWCVEMVYINGMNRFMCEHCLNGAMPLYQLANCGSKICRHVECPHHPEFGKQNALQNVLRTRGGLIAYSQQKHPEVGAPKQPLLTA